MTARCPSNSDHRRFITPAHVMEDWFVNEHGEFIGLVGVLETIHGPDPMNIWECADCGEIAVVVGER